MDSKVLWVVVGAVVVWLLLRKTESTVKNINTSNRQTYTAGTAASSLATNLAPALGTFLGKLANSYGSGSSGGIVSSGDSWSPTFDSSTSDGSAFADDSIDYNDFA
jgi:hypothetical protein